MSQLKDFSQVSQEQVFNELKAYAKTVGVLDFIKMYSSIQVSLLELILEIEDEFPDGKVELNTFEANGEEKLRLFLVAPIRTPIVIEKFNKFRNHQQEELSSSLQGLVVMNIRFSDSEDEDTWDELDELIGAIEGPEDWAAEHDHYLYGTPKLNQ